MNRTNIVNYDKIIWPEIVITIFLGCSPHQLPVEPVRPSFPSPMTAPLSHPASPPGMVFVPGGTFLMGELGLTGEPTEGDTEPLQAETVPSFYLDQTEVTAKAFHECVLAGKCDLPTMGVNEYILCNYDKQNRNIVNGKELHPINCLPFQKAKQYCEAQGKRLPSEIEWEYAARGPASSPYPWGNAFPGQSHGCWGSGPQHNVPGTCPVKQYGATLLGKDESAENGLYDMGGNVEEFVDSQYTSSLPASHQPCSADCVFKGSAWVTTTDPHLELHMARRGHAGIIPGWEWSTIGFRCAMSVPVIARSTSTGGRIFGLASTVGRAKTFNEKNQIANR